MQGGSSFDRTEIDLPIVSYCGLGYMNTAILILKLVVDRIVVMLVPVVMYDQSEIVLQRFLNSTFMTEEGKRRKFPTRVLSKIWKLFAIY